MCQWPWSFIAFSGYKYPDERLKVCGIVVLTLEMSVEE